MEMIICFALGMITAGVVIYTLICQPDSMETFFMGFEAGVKAARGEDDADSTLSE